MSMPIVSALLGLLQRFSREVKDTLCFALSLFLDADRTQLERRGCNLQSVLRCSAVF